MMFDAGRGDASRYRRALADLSTEPVLPIGTRVFVAEDRHIYTSIGNTTPEIAARLGWMQNNIWMPDAAMHHVQRNHPILVDPIAIASTVLQEPLSVHQDHREPNAVYFIIRGATLRERGLLPSASIPYVDAVVELRKAVDRVVPRLFHLSPRDRNKGGAQLWP